MTVRLSQVEIGHSFSVQLVEDLTRTQIVQYAGASGDYNPLHTDELYATEGAGYPSVFAHGMLTMGMTARALTDYVGDGRLVTYGGRFLTPVWPGDTLSARIEVTGLVDRGGKPCVTLRVTTLNANEEEVFRGDASARLDE